MSTLVLIVCWLAGFALFLYVIIPGMVQGPIGAELYRACVLQPRSWPVGVPFTFFCFAVALLWPVAGVTWYLLRVRTPFICTQALLEAYGLNPTEHAPAVTLVPRGIPPRIQGRSGLPTEFASTAEFWTAFWAERS